MDSFTDMLPTVYTAMAERLGALDLDSDGRVVRMWVPNPDRDIGAPCPYHCNCFSPPRSKWVPVRAELVVVFD